MRGLSCAAANDAVLSSSITATMCCRQMSGISRLFTTAAGARRHANHDVLHLIGVERTAAQQVVERVERRLDRRTHGPLLDVGPRHFVALAQRSTSTAGLAVGAFASKKLSSPENTSSTPLQSG